MQLRRVCTPVELHQPFAGCHNVGMQEAGWTHRRIAAHVGHNVSVVYPCFQQWSVEHSHTRRPGFGWSRSTHAHQDRCIVQAMVAAQTASREEIQAHVASAVSKTIGNHLLAADSDHVCSGHVPFTPRHHKAWLLWCHEKFNWRV